MTSRKLGVDRSIIMARLYYASHTDLFPRRFQCVHCHFGADVVVRGEGGGFSATPLPFWLKQGEEVAWRAQLDASRDAAKDAREHLRLWPCPRCGLRDDRAFVVKRAVQMFALAAGFGGLAVGFALTEAPTLAWLFGPASLLAPLLLYHHGLRATYTSVGQRVILRADLEAMRAAETANDTPDGEEPDSADPPAGDVGDGIPPVVPARRPRPVSAERERKLGERMAQLYLGTTPSPGRTTPTTLILFAVIAGAIVFALTR